MSIHGAPIPCPPGKASLVLVCAHAWEARPFLIECGLQPISVAYLPHSCYGGEWNGVAVHLVLTGGGRSRSALAVGAWLSHSLRDSGHPCGAGLQAPPLVVANFGTAGAYARTWSVGQTLLVSKVRLEESGPKESLYPERIVPWTGDETECRTVPVPQIQVDPGDHARGHRPVYDMEAFGVAEATATFLSLAHLVIGKCVSDEIPERGSLCGDQALDWKSLAQRCEADYDRGAVVFLKHALLHLRAIEGNSRRKQSEEIKATVDALLATAQESLPLTVSQQRDLAQHLRARLAECTAPETVQLVAHLKALLKANPATDKSGAKKVLANLVGQIRGRL